ncbi:hypothetical protein ACFQVA_28615 [Actinomadura keratinilytica]
MRSETAQPDPLTHGAERPSLLRQPMAVWATAGASVVAFMGIGLVDPILPRSRRAWMPAPPRSPCSSPRTS